MTRSPSTRSTSAAPIVTPKTTQKSPKKATIRRLSSKRSKVKINDYNIQVAAVNKSMEFMGIDFWVYVVGSRKRYKWRAQMLQEVREACGFQVSYSTLRRWIGYYQRYGVVPAKSNRHRISIKGERTVGPRAFTQEYANKLQKIVDDRPQLYLDEVQLEIYYQTGKLFSATTVWRHLHTIDYSLKKVVFRARQQKQEEVEDYNVRLND